jgi:hypothetical protein
MNTGDWRPLENHDVFEMWTLLICSKLTRQMFPICLKNMGVFNMCRTTGQNTPTPGIGGHFLQRRFKSYTVFQFIGNMQQVSVSTCLESTYTTNNKNEGEQVTAEG